MWELDCEESWALKNWSFWTVVLEKIPVVTYGCESWTIKKVEGQRIGAFELWCCRKLPRVPWTARRLNQSISREINPEYLLEELKLKLQYFGHLMRTPDWLEKSLMLEKIASRRRGRQRMRWLMASPMQWTWPWANFRRWWGTERPGVPQSMGLKGVGHNWESEQEQQALESRCGYQDLPGDPAVHSVVPCRGHGFHPWLGNLKSHMMCPVAK